MRRPAMADDLATRLKYLLHSASHYSLQCPQLAAHLTERFTTLSSKAGIGHTSCAGSSSSRLQWCPRCSTLFTPNSAHWRTLPAKALRSKRRKHRHSNRRGIYWLDKPLGKHDSYMMVDCLACGGSFVASGLNKPSSKTRRSSVDNSLASLVKTKTPSTTKMASPAIMTLSTPRERNSTPSNRGRLGSTPSNQHRRSSTLKAQLAKSSSQQKLLHEKGNSPKLSTFLTSVQ